MEDYVKRSDVLERFTFEHGDRIPEVCDNGEVNTISFRHAKSLIRSLPTADVAPVVHGRWEHLGGDEWNCSCCGFVICTDGSWEKPPAKHCQDCGAKMDLEG